MLRPGSGRAMLFPLSVRRRCASASTPTERLFPDRFVGVPALALELPGERFDRAIVVLGLAAFLVAAGFFRQIELRTVASSTVVITGLETHSISRSDAPGLSGDTSAAISIFSVRLSAGNT